MSDEIFGPILPIVPVDDVKTAVEFINERDQPLALYMFTSRRDVQEYILTYTRSGGVVSGDMLCTMPSMPCRSEAPVPLAMVPTMARPALIASRTSALLSKRHLTVR